MRCLHFDSSPSRNEQRHSPKASGMRETYPSQRSSATRSYHAATAPEKAPRALSRASGLARTPVWFRPRDTNGMFSFGRAQIFRRCMKGFGLGSIGLSRHYKKPPRPHHVRAHRGPKCSSTALHSRWPSHLQLKPLLDLVHTSTPTVQTTLTVTENTPNEVEDATTFLEFLSLGSPL
jgi:hypothetical protein